MGPPNAYMSSPISNTPTARVLLPRSLLSQSDDEPQPLAPNTIVTAPKRKTSSTVRNPIPPLTRDPPAQLASIDTVAPAGRATTAEDVSSDSSSAYASSMDSGEESSSGEEAALDEDDLFVSVSSLNSGVGAADMSRYPNGPKASKTALRLSPRPS